ncbi:MAG: flagellar basal body P-ring formation chaperone FlgA [Planctomycetota bacterium]|jgi:flagella basal body P-ring formation protein FlgA
MMNNKICLILAWVFGVCAVVCGSEAGNPQKIRIYLPKDKTLESEVVELGKIALVLGDDDILPLVNELQLGKFSVHGQEIRIDRKTILSRLASMGIKSSWVTFNGAERISVCRDESTITTDRFVDAARDYLGQQLSAEQIETLKLTRPIKAYPLDDRGESVTLKAISSTRRSDRIKYVTVQVIRDGVELGRRELSFSVQYPSVRLIAKQALSAGELISPENTKAEKYMSDVPAQPSVASIYGMAAKRDIAGGTTITEKMAKYKEPPVLIKKRQKVILKLDTGGLLVSAPGEAAEDGRVGDIIPVQRGSRQTRDLKIVLGKVMPDGTVRPVL